MIKERILTVPSQGFDISKFRRLTKCRATEDFCVLDIEAFKVPAPEGWPVKMRFQPMMVGLGYWDIWAGTFTSLIGASDDESEMVDWLEDVISRFKAIVFYATRDFDKNVLEGRWTNARRALSLVTPTWPILSRQDWLPEEERQEWINLRKYQVSQVSVDRTGDPFAVSSEGVLRWPLMNESDREGVWLHNELDVLELGKTLEIVFPCKK